MLRREVEQVVGEYLFDCTDFRTDDKDDLLRQVYEMTDRRFALAEHLLRRKPWELFVDGRDGHRPDAPRVLEGHGPRAPQARRRAAATRTRSSTTTGTSTRWSARLLEHADDDTAVLVVSDHGAKRMDGGIRVNEWLRREGLLRDAARADRAADVARRRSASTGRRTTAWGEGGYYSRIFLNVEGREPKGTIPPADYERVRDELAARLAAIPDDDGEPIATQVYKPEEVYPEVNGVAPDLIVHFGDLLWRSVGTVGGDEGIHTFENDTGPDDANHAQDGMLIMAGPGVEPGPRARACTCSTSRRPCSTCSGSTRRRRCAGRSLLG